MPYVPPHKRMGYVHVNRTRKIEKGRVHWPTNVNNHRATNVIQPDTQYSPTRESLGLKKSALKHTEPITLNTEPLARPSSRVKNYPKKFRNAVSKHLKKRRKTRKSS